MENIKKVFKSQVPSILVAMGHGGTHWVNAAIYLLLPYITLDLGLSYTQAGLIMTVFLTSTFASNAVSGPLVDIAGNGRYARFQAYALAIGGFALLLMSIASSIYMLFISVMLMGVSISLWHPAAITYLSVRYPESRGFVLSVHSIGASLGDALSPLLGAALLTYMAWNSTSAILSVPLFILMIIILVFLKDGPIDKKPIIKQEDKDKDSYIDSLRILLKNMQLIPLFLVAGVRTLTQNGILVFMPLYLVTNQGLSPAVMGSSLFIMQIGGLFSGPIAGVLSDKYGRKIIAIISLMISAILVPFYIIINSHILIVILSGIIGFAIYAGRPVVQGWALDISSEKTSGSVISLLFMVQVGSAGIFTIIAGFIADIYGIEIIFIILSLICITALTIASFIPSKIIKS